MSFDHLRQVSKQDAERVHGQRGALQYGIVTSSQSNPPSVRVTVQPSNILSGWLPVATAWRGNGWGMLCVPTPGTQVIVQPQEGDLDSGIVIGCVYSQLNGPPPGAVGELVFEHSTGSRISLNNDGTVTITGHANINVTAPLTTIRAMGSTLYALCNKLFYDWATSHTHPGTGPPSSPPAANTLTQNLTAS